MRTQAAAVYPPALCHSILRGVVAQRIRGGLVLPDNIDGNMAIGQGVYDLEEKGDAARDLALLALEAAAGMEAGTLVDLGDDAEIINPHCVSPRLRMDEEGGEVPDDSPSPDSGMVGIDDVTGQPIPADLVAKARQEEIAFMQSWGCGRSALGLRPGRGQEHPLLAGYGWTTTRAMWTTPTSGAGGWRVASQS